MRNKERIIRDEDDDHITDKSIRQIDRDVEKKIQRKFRIAKKEIIIDN